MKLRTIIKLVVTTVATGLALPVGAVDMDSFGGHSVTIKEKDFQKVLVVDGRELHTDEIITFDDIYAFNDTLVVVGSSSPGGNACDASPFVLSFPAKGAPRFDGPIDSCASVSHQVDGASFVFSTGNVPGHDTERWQWTAGGGITSLPSVAFKPDASTGWANLRERAFTHPSDAFKNGEIAESLKAVLGADFDHFQELMSGVGSGQFKGDDFVGSACRPHACLDEAGMIFLSSHDRRVYAAWKPDGKKIAVFPSPVKEWPDRVKTELKDWAKQWP
ncbi:hypothetical protein HGP17_25145 [Rhizobium sp. P38BS-XIX]|uniref:hypothetical protein n=1 Tax=Rhizobium sp. P38BS-XIX TaxID=2726740 RepID=UPI001457724A|nr:hypothetical protein [Rhizobium sp. P38BS-XIX]NLS00126.1 hypothetical protein [Rhizobium sp. P38BS-XIX]